MKSKLMLATLITLLISGCTQDELVKSESSNGRQFTASFEQNESRTYIEEGNLLRWTAEDQISLFEGNALNQQYQFTGKTGANGGYFNKVNNTFGTGNDLGCHYAIYPYDSDIEITDSGVITATLPSEQSYAENSFGLGDNTMVAVTQNVDDTFLKFKNVGGYLKLQLYGDDVTVKTITLQGNSNEKIAGTATITATYGGNPIVSMADDATETITLDCGEGVKIGTTEETATAFWLVVPPTTFENGFTVIVTDINEREFTQTTSNEIAVERNAIKPMSAIQTECTIPCNQLWYTSTDGNVITPIDGTVFGANIVSNSYENGKGVIVFDGNISQIGSLTTSSSQAFFDCSTLNSIEMPQSVTAIGNYAFGSTSITDIKIPNGVTTIGEFAFRNCTSLVNVILPISVTSLAENSFYFCESLETITMPNITSIGNQAFYGCYALKNISIPNSLLTIGRAAFQDCNSLISVTIPRSVVSIGNSAFQACKKMESIVVEDDNSEYSSFDGVLYNKNKDLLITCPNAKTSIAFANETETIGANAFSGSSLTEIDIPNGIKTIGDYAFMESALSQITIPASVETIGNMSFYTENFNLSKIYFKAQNPPSLGYSAFYCTSSSLVIYVPQGYENNYKNATEWSDYTKNIQGYSF